MPVCAAGIALGVLLPDLVNVAGVAPIMIRMADGTLETIAGLGHLAQIGCRPDLFKEAGKHSGRRAAHHRCPRRPMRGSTALERHGTMRFADVIAAAAIKCAGGGVRGEPAAEPHASGQPQGCVRALPEQCCDLPARWQGAAGRARRFVQSDLARTLTYMADQDRAAPDRAAGLRAAHDAFYRGDIARQIVAFQEAEGGYLRMDDLANIGRGSSRRWCGRGAVTRWRCVAPGAKARRCWRHCCCWSRLGSTGWSTTRPSTCTG